MNFYHDEGLQTFDFGVTRPNTGNWDFKKRWCRYKEPEKVYYLYNAKDGIIDPREKKFSLLQKIWRDYLPSPIANLIGPTLRGKMGK